MKAVSRTVHFSLGPVQGFVAQARRTRDLLVGSFLLSYLSASAMAEVIKRGGEVIFPYIHPQGKSLNVNDPLVRAILDRDLGLRNDTGQKNELPYGPFIGSVPNRFQVRLPERVHPNMLKDAVMQAWHRIAEAVWRRYVEPVAMLGEGTKDIWVRQVNGFWEIMWAVGDDRVLDRRKNWRFHVPTAESGEKCMLIHYLQELSGYTGVRQKEKRDAFWKALRERLSPLDLGERERLSAVGLVKRLFPHVAEEAIGWRFPEQALYVPSTVYLAAVPWLVKVSEATVEDQTSSRERDSVENKSSSREWSARISAFMKAVEALGVRTVREYSASVRVIRELQDRDPYLKRFLSLNGNYFYAELLQNPRLWMEFAPDPDLSINELTAQLLEIEKALKELVENIGFSPRPFYAVLLMDGDRMGVLRRSYGPVKVAQALASFTNKVERIVDEHNGVLVYAGGDDVLALFPMTYVLRAAQELRRTYQCAFGEGYGLPTISAAVLYVHHHIPLQAVIREVHRLLDEVAKDETGRDSLAVGVWKQSGRTVTWSAPWNEVLTPDGENTRLEQLIDALNQDLKNISTYSNSFFYKIRERYEPFWNRWEHESEKKEETLYRLLTAEYLQHYEADRRRDPVLRKQVERRIAELLEVCRRKRRVEYEGNVKIESGELKVDGALLVRFLSRQGGDED